MPFYRVLIEGTNLRIPGEQNQPPIVGFFTTRVVWSSTQASAEAKAMQSVRQLWAMGSYGSQPSAKQLKLAVSESGPSTLWRWLSAPNKGHAFFAAEASGEA
jgi:hypothetical protein